MLSNRFIHTAVIFFVIAVFLGLFMGMTQNFTLLTVHVHLNLLGWVSMALIGLLYAAYPHLQRGWQPRLQYGLHTGGLVLMMSGMALAKSLQEPRLIGLVIAGSLMLCMGVLLLAFHILTQLRTVRHA